MKHIFSKTIKCAILLITIFIMFCTIMIIISFDNIQFTATVKEKQEVTLREEKSKRYNNNILIKPVKKRYITTLSGNISGYEIQKELTNKGVFENVQVGQEITLECCKFNFFGWIILFDFRPSPKHPIEPIFILSPDTKIKIIED